MKAISRSAALAAAAILVASCGGSDGAKSPDAGSGDPTSTMPSGGTTGAGGETATTAGSGEDELFGSGAAIILVDGLAYDLCALVPEGVASIESMESRPEVLYELGGNGWSSEPEGSVTCEWTGEMGSFFRVVAWSDDALRFALGAEDVSASERIARWKDDRRAQAAANAFPVLEVPQSDGWLDTDVDEYDTNSLGLIADGVVVAVQSMDMDESCFGEDEEIHACQQTRIDEFEPDARLIAETVLAALLSGDGQPATWPQASQPVESILVSGGQVDVCGLARDALAEKLGVGYVLHAAYETEDSSTGAGPIVTCDLEPADRDFYPEVMIDVADADTTGWDAAVDAGRSDIEGTLPGAVADESFVDSSSAIWMRSGSIWVRAMSFAQGSASYDSRVVDALTLLATRL